MPLRNCRRSLLNVLDFSERKNRSEAKNVPLSALENKENSSDFSDRDRLCDKCQGQAE